jgi:hexokinase
MNLTWVMGFPTGEENGSFLTLDLGGTNLRVCKVTLCDEAGKHTLKQEQYKMPEELKTGKAKDLWEYVAESLEKFIKKYSFQEYPDNEQIPLGFTFSYPATQDYIDHGKLQTWTKGFDIEDVEGHDVSEQLREAMEKRVSRRRTAILLEPKTL